MARNKGINVSIKKIIISPGEPAGIGPDIIIQAAQNPWPAELIVIGDPNLFIERARLLKLPLQLIPFDTEHSSSHQPQTLKIIPMPLTARCQPGILNKQNADYVISSLSKAADYCLQGNANALVTGPIQKSILNDAGISFTGHTEFLATLCQAPQAVMLFVTPKMKVALATTHLPLAKVSNAITPALLTSTLRVLHDGMLKLFQCADPKILVCGLNPHAGENGHLGSEEIAIIQPALEKLRAEKINVIGPLPADTIFTEKYLNMADVIFAMYHDQALPVVKFSEFYAAVNVTLGLPIIRTSVDHGTALDLAGSGLADSRSLSAAIKLAIECCSRQ